MKKLLIIFFAILFGYVIGLLTDEGVRDAQDQPVLVRTDTIVRIDTIRIPEPKLRDSVIIRWETRYLAIHEDHNNGGDVQTATLMSDEEAGEVSEDDDTITHRQYTPPNSVYVDLPIVQRVYGDDRYTAWVSGYEASLDSIQLYDRIIQIENEMMHPKKERRWGCVAGVGVGVGTKGIAPMVGVTIGYRLF